MKPGCRSTKQMTGISENINHIKATLPAGVKLVAVSKTKPVGDILEIYRSGQRLFGENRVQELLNKKDLLPADIEWHLIGHLQTNKVKFIVPFIGMIQSVDSFKLLSLINQEASKIDRVINCLLQVHIADEQSKYGFSVKELSDLLQKEDLTALKNVRICGLMGMATFTQDSDQVFKEFSFLREYFDSLRITSFKSSSDFREISMGMSGDYNIALKAGSTMVRIGSLIFGSR
jgi:PLP dependent protein